MALWVLILVSVLPVANSVILSGVESGDATVKAECGPDSMTVTVDVDNNFKGKVYAKDHLADCEYSLKAGTATTYVRSFAYDSTDCGQALVTKDDGSREFSLTTIVRYNTALLLTEDKSHDSTCKFDNEHAVNTNLGTVNGSESNLEQSDGTVDGDVSSQLQFTIEKVDDSGAKTAVSDSDEVPLGEELTIKIELTKSAVFETMLVYDCVASNRADDTANGYTALNLLDSAGCRASDNLDPVVPGGASYADTAAKFTFRLLVNAFMFVEGKTGDKNQLHFSCSVKLCAPGDSTTCDTGNCGQRVPRSVHDARKVSRVKASGEKVRVRRAAEPVRVGGGVTVVSEAKKTEETHKTPTDADNCLDNPKIQAILVAMGMFLLALLVVVITLIILSCRRRRRREGDEAKIVDDGLSTASSTQKLTPEHFVK